MGTPTERGTRLLLDQALLLVGTQESEELGCVFESVKAEAKEVQRDTPPERHDNGRNTRCRVNRG